MVLMIIACFGVLLAVAYMVYRLPDENAKRRRRLERKEQELSQAKPEEKNWKEIAQRWEKGNMALTGDIEKLKAQQKAVEKNLQQSQAAYKELVEKLALEKGWREKEQVNLDKAKTHEKDLKEQIIRTEKDLEGEHSTRLRTEREFQDLKVRFDAAMEEKRVASTHAMSLETTVKQMTAELKELRRQNEELKKRKDDIQWVAKSSYDELAEKYNKLRNERPS